MPVISPSGSATNIGFYDWQSRNLASRYWSLAMAQKSIAWLTKDFVFVVASLHAHFQSSLELQCAFSLTAAVNNLSLRSHFFFAPPHGWKAFFREEAMMKKSSLHYGEQANLVLNIYQGSRVNELAEVHVCIGICLAEMSQKCLRCSPGSRAERHFWDTLN